MVCRTTNSTDFATFLLVSQIDPQGIRLRIRQARKEAGLTQQELADLLEVHKRTIENYENERVPDYRALNRLASVLSRPVGWFLHGDESATPQDEGVRQELEALRRDLEEREQRLEKRFEELAEMLRDLHDRRSAG